MADNADANEPSPKEVLNRFYVFFVPLFLLVFSFIAIEYYADLKIFRGSLKNDETQQVKMAEKAITNEMHNVLSDLIFLSRLNEIWDLLDDVNDERARLMVAQEILYFSEKNPVYDQIAILGSDGEELIRISFDDGDPYIVEKQHLRNKKHEKYFNETFDMEIGGVYMSHFEENETGESVIQFATPLFASKGKQGVLLFDYRGSEIIHILYQATIEISTHMSMISAQGVWLGSPFQDERKNFLTNSENSFALEFPEAWKKISSTDSGSFIIDSGMFTFETVYPKVSILEFYSELGKDNITSTEAAINTFSSKGWKLVSRISSSTLNNQMKQFYSDHWLPYSIVFSLIVVISYFLTQSSIRRRTVKEHADYERRFITTLNNIKLPVIRLNTNGDILFCNPHLLELLNAEKDDVIGKNWFDNFVDSGMRHKERILFKNIVSGITPPVSTEACIHTIDDEKRYIAWNNTLSTNPHGKVITLTSIGHDITEQRRLEKEVDERNKEIARTQTLAAMGQMASMIAHDLRNPLSSIKMTLQILSKNTAEAFPAGISEISELSLDQVRYMEAILADLLQYSRPDAIQPDWLCVNDVLDRATNTLQKVIRDNSVNITKEYQKNLPRIYADPNKLCQVFSNLISNAIQAATDINKKPVIIVKTGVVFTNSTSKIEVDIIDNGPGVDSSQEEKLFDPFYTTRAKGTGLGLPIVKRIIDQHNGSIRLFKVENGNGTCSHVVLPTNPTV